jgi:hypothetical protein
MNRFSYAAALFSLLIALAGCDRAGPASRATDGAAVAATTAAPATMRAPASTMRTQASTTHAPTTRAKPVPDRSEANLAMLRAAQGPGVKLQACSTRSGDEYDKCMAANAAAIKAAYGRDASAP